jgi:ribulose-5-phosphate 4-epimerase/fuculose-1-phosphate aldolase
MSSEIMRTDVLNATRTMLRMGLTFGESGSVSARVGESAGRMLLAITPQGRYVDELASHDIVIVSEEGKQVTQAQTTLLGAEITLTTA